MTAQGIEAGTGETEGLDPQGESSVRQDAPYIQGPPLRDDGPLETMARAIIEAQGYSPSENELARARDEVPGIITALTEAGYAIVPVTPTEEMLEVGAHCASSVPIPYTAEHIYRAMVAAFIPPFQVDTKEGE